jgi:hypothetical protein
MEIDDIEKAAKHYQEKDHDIWTDKGMATELQKAFKAGASWRIGSVWHDAREKPDKGKLLIAEDIDSAYDLVYSTKSKPWEELSEENHYMRWACIEDLLPCKEEGGGDE